MIWFRIFSGLLLMTSGLYAQAPIFEKSWDQRFGGTDDDIIGSFEMTPDSGFILGGSIFSEVSGDVSELNYDTSLATSDYWMVKCDPLGNISWEKRFGGMLSEVIKNVILTSDNGFVAGGQSSSDDDGDKSEPSWDTTLLSYDYWIIKTNDQGTKLWDKRFGGTSYEMFADLAEDQSGNFVLAGSSFSGISGDKTQANQGGWDYWIVYTDDSGNKIWDRRFGGLMDDFVTSVAVTTDSCFILGGYSNSEAGGDKTENNNGGWDYWILKIDAAGNKIWDKTFGGSATDWLFALTIADDGILIGGQSYSPVSGDKSEPNHGPASDSDRWIIKTDASGNKMWDRSIGGIAVEDVSRVVTLPDGGFLISGESYSDISGDKTENNLGPEQTWVVKIDASGNLLWDKTLFTYGHDEVGSAIPYGEKCFVSVNFTVADTGGYKSQSNWGDSDFWMVKMCEVEPSIVTENDPENNITVFPNPFTDQMVISGLPEGSSEVYLFDATGRKVTTEIITDREHTVSTSGLAPGYYVVAIYTDKANFFVPVIREQ